MFFSYYEKIGNNITCIDDEIPFEIPENWCWCRLSSLLTFIRNGATIKQYHNAKGYPITRIETIATEQVNRSRFGYADIYDLDSYQNFILKDGDILMSHINSPKHLCKCALYEKMKDEQIIHGMNLLNLRFMNTALARYVINIFRSTIFKNYVWAEMKHSVNQASITTTAISAFMIPLPPQLEQIKILEKLDILNTNILEIEKSLS